MINDSIASIVKDKVENVYSFIWKLFRKNSWDSATDALSEYLPKPMLTLCQTGL